jgi:hypothetical protein
LKLETEPVIDRVEVTDDRLHAHMADGRTITVPLAWYPRLLHGSPQERRHYEIHRGGSGIHWPDLDEDISIKNLLEGRKSGESDRSFRRWLETRRGDLDG